MLAETLQYVEELCKLGAMTSSSWSVTLGW